MGPKGASIFGDWEPDTRIELEDILGTCNPNLACVIDKDNEDPGAKVWAMFPADVWRPSRNLFISWGHKTVGHNLVTNNNKPKINIDYSQMKIKIQIYVVVLQAVNANALLLWFLEMWDR